MKKLVAFIILLAAGGGGWWYYIKYGKPPEKPQVVQASISRGTITEAVTSTGTLEPLRRYDVGSQVSGTVKAIHVDYNTIVRKDQLLAEIDPQLLQVQVQIQEANIERQLSDIANQKVQLEDQKKQFERTKSLFEKGLQNQQQYEAAELAIKTREAQIASAEKSLVQARANLESAKLNVSYTRIIAPADGVVVERRVDVGQTVQASMSAPSFFVLSTPLQNLKLTALVDEAEIGRIRPGMEVRFTVDAYGQQNFFGTVDAVRLNASVNNNVVTYPVWITVPNQDLRLRPSMTANLRIVISTAEDVTRVPSQAIRFRPNTEIYTALGLTPPAPGQGRAAGPGATNDDNGRNGGAARPGGQGAGAQQAQPGQTPAAGRNQPGTTPQAGAGREGTRQPQAGQGGAQAGQGGQRTQGRGFGQGSDLANMSPEQRQQLMERFAAGGGRGGRGGGGGRGGNQAPGTRTGRGGQGGGARGTTPAVPTAAQQNADKIDELWAPVQRTESRGTVYTWDEAKKELKAVQVRLGVTDGSFHELLSGEVKVGDQVVTGVILPASMRTTTSTQGNPLFGNQPGRGQPGMGGMGGGGFPGGGGGGNPGGGGGGRGGGGGGR